MHLYSVTLTPSTYKYSHNIKNNSDEGKRFKTCHILMQVPEKQALPCTNFYQGRQYKTSRQLRQKIKRLRLPPCLLSPVKGRGHAGGTAEPVGSTRAGTARGTCGLGTAAAAGTARRRPELVCRGQGKVCRPALGLPVWWWWWLVQQWW